MDRNQIKDALRNNEVIVEFTNVNGDYRKMTCTLQESVVPKPTKTDPLTQKKVRAINEEVCVVYDVNAKGWRSFRWDSIVNTEIVTPFTDNGNCG